MVFSQGYLANAIEVIAKQSNSTIKVTEIGCYNARLMNFLIQRKVVVSYTGVDIRKEYLDESELIDHPHVTLLNEDAIHYLSIPKESQDVVVSSEVLEHIDEVDLKDLLTNMVTLLAPGGTLITSFPENTDQCVFHIVSNETDMGHVNFPVYPEYIYLVEGLGMKLISYDSGFTVRSSYVPPDSISSSNEYKKIYRMLGHRMALAYAMTIDEGHTGGGYYTFRKEEV